MNTKIIFTTVCSSILLFVVFGFGPIITEAQTIECPANSLCIFSTATDLANTPSVDTTSDPILSAPAFNPSTTATSPASSYTPSTSIYSPYTPINQVNNGTSACPMFSQSLRLGNNGTAVSALQTWLMNKGYAIASIASGKNQKGYYGYETYTALSKYQKVAGVRVTGVLDTATMNKINGSCVSSVNTQGVVPVTNQQAGVQAPIQNNNAAIQAAIQAAVAKYRAAGGR